MKYPIISSTPASGHAGSHGLAGRAGEAAASGGRPRADVRRLKAKSSAACGSGKAHPDGASRHRGSGAASFQACRPEFSSVASGPDRGQRLRADKSMRRRARSLGVAPRAMASLPLSPAAPARRAKRSGVGLEIPSPSSFPVIAFWPRATGSADFSAHGGNSRRNACWRSKAWTSKGMRLRFPGFCRKPGEDAHASPLPRDPRER